MRREDFVLAALSLGKGKTFTPVQIQKLFFLIDRRIPRLIGGPYFNFVPYDYGPFDTAVYTSLETLAQQGFVELIVIPDLRRRKYRLTDMGRAKGMSILENMDNRATDYISTLVEFVTSLSFAQLVGAIYKEYPEMRKKSVFRDT